jgi:alkyl sulfatase BDS1-like metallo-beta-lactamase superfamily hydrolase
MIASHHWPRWGNDRIQEVMKANRDIYAHRNNQLLHYVNQGVTINEIHNVYRAPRSLQEGWITRFYHGSQENNARGVVNKYLGHRDANPATLIPLSPRDSAPLYVEMMGGSSKIMAKGKKLNDAGKYRHAVEILDRLVFAEPDNQGAKDLLADAYEQLGYQQENPGLRNAFLAGAYELRSGVPEGSPPKSLTSDMIQARARVSFRESESATEGPSHQRNLAAVSKSSSGDPSRSTVSRSSVPGLLRHTSLISAYFMEATALPLISVTESPWRTPIFAAGESAIT